MVDTRKKLALLALLAFMAQANQSGRIMTRRIIKGIEQKKDSIVSISIHKMTRMLTFPNTILYPLYEMLWGFGGKTLTLPRIWGGGKQAAKNLHVHHAVIYKR